MVEVGEQAPDVALLLAGGTERLSALTGKPLVLYFYPKDDTPGCTREAQDFTGLAPEFAKAGVRIIGVSKDSAKRHAKFADKYELAVDLAADESGAVCEAFGVWVEKSLYGRQYMGIARATFLIGADGRIAQIWRKVKVAGHADAVLAAAKAL
ncbi:Thioredoxin peroxidase [Sphingomonas antarctica]|uniref:peroxiredoxin n=1 Tax=Sphingomonas antarctica TaxID=2040274 RepID=UPI0039E8ABF5